MIDSETRLHYFFIFLFLFGIGREREWVDGMRRRIFQNSLARVNIKMAGQVIRFSPTQ